MAAILNATEKRTFKSFTPFRFDHVFQGIGSTGDAVFWDASTGRGSFRLESPSLPRYDDCKLCASPLTSHLTVVKQSWNASDGWVMDQRLALLLTSCSDSQSSPSRSLRTLPFDPSKGEPPPGWELLDESDGWRPCPIGVHWGG